MSKVTIDRERIGPAKAREYLELNLHNRPEKEAVQIEVCNDILRGDWKETLDPIKFSYPNARLNGYRGTTLLDGQNRLKGIIRSGKTVVVWVARGLEPEAQDAMDTGAKRSFGDVLALREVKNANLVASITRGVFLYQATGEPQLHSRGGQTYNRASYFQLLEQLEQEPSIHEWATFAGSFTKQDRSLGLPASLVGTLAWAIAEEADTETVITFFNEILTPPAQAAATAVLRRRLQSAGENRKKGVSIPTRYRAAWTIKGWNFWIVGERPSRISWRHDEPFPEIQGPVE